MSPDRVLCLLLTSSRFCARAGRLKVTKTQWARSILEPCFVKVDNPDGQVDVLMSRSAATGQANFAKVRQGASVLLIREDFRDARLEEALLAGEERLAERYAMTRVHAAKSSRVYRLTIDGPDGEAGAYFKEYLDRSLWDRLKHIVRASRAQRAFRASLMLMERGFQAPDLVATGRTRSGLVIKRSYLLTREVSASVRVSDYLTAKGGGGLGRDALRLRRALIQTLGRTVGEMHRQGIVHGDLRLGNVLARQDGTGWQLFFLDNERTRRFPWIPPSLRLKNLVQVNMLCRNVAMTDRFRFFRAYASACPAVRPHYKRWIRKVQARTLQRQAPE